MAKIAVIKNAGSPQANLLLNGVYGAIQHDESGGSRFRIDPEFHRISYLFSLMEDGQLPVNSNDYQEYDVPDEMVTSVKAMLMHNRCLTWDNLYEAAGKSDATPVGSMLAMESNRTLGNARNHLYSMGAHAFDVTYEFDGTSKHDSAYYETFASLLSNMQVKPGSQLRILSAEMVSNDAIGRNAPVEPATHRDDLKSAMEPREWTFSGHHADGKIVATVRVVAMNETAAKEVAAMALGVSEQNLDQVQNTEEFNGDVTTGQELGEVIVAANNRIVNSMRDNILSGLLTPHRIAVENLCQGERIVYQEHHTVGDLDEDEDRNWDRPQY